MSDEQWYWCLTHKTVERGAACRATDRMGPYPSRQAALDWQSSHESRADTWEQEDRDWEEWND